MSEHAPNRASASLAARPSPPPLHGESTLSAAQWGMLSFLVSEVALFSTLIVAYVTFLGSDRVGPTPAEALRLPLVLASTACLLASSFTIHMAEKALHAAAHHTTVLPHAVSPHAVSPHAALPHAVTVNSAALTPFRGWWTATIVLGVVFLLGTAYEWHELITEHHLTISRNLFGTSYYTLVGFHALHVTVGLVAMSILLGLSLTRKLAADDAAPFQLAAWYWHFVDCVWIVVFLVVYT